MKNIIYIALTCTILMACGDKIEENIAEETQKNVETEQAKESVPITQNIECFGVIDVPPFSVLEIFAKTNGYITDLSVLEGQHVKKGEVLAEIESPEFAHLQKEYKTAKANYDWQKLNFERNQKLYDSKTISDKDFQFIEKEYLVAKSTFMGLKEEIRAIGFDDEQFLSATSSRLSIRSKTHVTVVKINVKNGTKVTPDTHLFTVLDKSHLHVEMKVSASNISKIALEQPFFMINSNDTIKGTVHLINDMIESDNTVKVHGHFSNPADEEKLIVGQKVFVQILP